MSCWQVFVNGFRFVFYLYLCFIFLYIKFDISKKYSIIANVIIKILFMKNGILKIMLVTVLVSGGIFISK